MSQSTTALSQFGRSIRDEPHYGIYPHRFFLEKAKVPVAEVESWLRALYVENKGKRGRLYRILKYRHTDGNQYVDCIMMQTCTEQDALYIKMRWGYSEHKIQRGDIQPRYKLNKENAAELRAIIAREKTRMYEEQMASKVEG